MKYSSQLMEHAVQAFAKFPGVGQKSALRFVLHLAQMEYSESETILHSLSEFVNNIKRCKKCNHFSDSEVCLICQSSNRDAKLICVVESSREVMKIEESGQYRGVYHVLGGVLRPIDGIGPDELEIDSLVRRIQLDHVEELIMAISPTIEGDTTIHYISNILKNEPVTISTVARGIAFGGELEYVDDVTLARSIIGRTVYDGN